MYQKRINKNRNGFYRHNSDLSKLFPSFPCSDQFNENHRNTYVYKTMHTIYIIITHG